MDFDYSRLAMELRPDTRISRVRRKMLGLLGHGVLLSACGGHEVLRSSDTGAHVALAPSSVKVVLHDRNVELSMLNHERGHGLAPAPLRPEDKRQMQVHAEQFKPMLVQALLQGVSAGLGTYLNNQAPAFQLGMQINRITMDLDGWVDVIVTVTLTRAGGAGNALWMRTVRDSHNQFGSDSKLAGDLAKAVLTEMRSSELIA